MRRILYFLIALISLPLTFFAAEQVRQFISRAAPKPADITIDTQSVQQSIAPIWAAFAQGGEEPPPMLTKTVPKLKELSPRLIRLDHIYDSYDIVSRGDAGYTYDFSRLDGTVADIVEIGAIPFFSLSYMPPMFTASGSVIDVPKKWEDWKDLVQKTIEHYSGQTGLNLTNVYYEVWNEPELPQFGQWQLSGEKDYRLLYFYSAAAAAEAQNVNPFFLGGPAAGSYRTPWVKDFIVFAQQNKLRLDFYSWHRYHTNPTIFLDDAKQIRNDLAHSAYPSIPLLLTEWGIQSENTTINNTKIAASFTVAAVSSFYKNVAWAFTFEVKDGPPPNGGKWGLLTHEQDINPLTAKPRFSAFAALNNMKGNTLAMTGEGTYVKGFATKNDHAITVILANYDRAEKNTERVPLTLTGLPPASYTVHYEYPLENTSGSTEIVATAGILKQSYLMPPNSILLITVNQNASLATFTTGKSGSIADQAFLLSNAPSFQLTTPDFELGESGNIQFDLKPLWNPTNQPSFVIFEAPYLPDNATIHRIQLAKLKKQTGDFLVLSAGKIQGAPTIEWPIQTWGQEWHHIECGWNEERIWLTVDNGTPVHTQATPIHNGQLFTLYPIQAAIDNLHITMIGRPDLVRNFDDSVTK